MSRKERLLDCMVQVIPWCEILDELGEDISGSHPDRKLKGVEHKLCIHLMQQWFRLSDEEAIDDLLDSPCARSFCGFDVSYERMPERTTLVNFRKYMGRLTAAVDAALDEADIAISRGTMVDATVIKASNKAKERDPDAGSTKKRGQLWLQAAHRHGCR